MRQIIFSIFVILTACTKEPLDCSIQTICKTSVYSYRTCDGGKTFTDVRLKYAVKTMSVCDTSEYKSKMFDMWERSAKDDDAIDVNFKKDHPNTCGCNQ